YAAVHPSLCGHWFGKRADDFAIRPERLGDERVTGGAQFRLLHVLAFARTGAGDGMHHRLPGSISVDGAEHRARICTQRLVDNETADEALAGAQSLRRDLMTQRTRHA